MNTEDIRKYAAEQGMAEEQALTSRNGTKSSRICRKGCRNLRESVMILSTLNQCEALQGGGGLPEGVRLVNKRYVI